MQSDGEGDGAPPLAIVGTGGHARELHQMVEDINGVRAAFRFVGWLDDAVSTHGTEVHGVPVLGGLEWLRGRPDVRVAVGIGAPHVRRRVVRRLEASGHVQFPTLVHPGARVGNRIRIGRGSVVCAGATLTTDLELGEHVLINTGATLTHDDAVHDFVTVAPGANVSGNVTLEEGVDVGTNATILQGLRVGAWSVVGAGAVVVRSVASNVTVVGVPARTIRTRDPGWHE